MKHQGDGYRIGATVVDTRGDVEAVVQKRDRGRYLIKGLWGGRQWWADSSELRAVTAEERLTLRLPEVGG
ncbi:hypothetical protein AF335_20330 [Streptomyces eurocidicus]|uniref:Uncharacterized protein n=1 Tax=Streptomyces eurocidicus TaxID=66423 RepID=A0A2N8NTJ4_STREU|nr:hypothetical protein [Streptomyces eurocidicus]PNE32093.1 hypothetical protein AF335_20330 [Streptomyces eurocidicus]